MFDAIETLLEQQNVLHHTNRGITICVVRDQQAGIDLGKELFYTIVDRRTALYLSGGRTPRGLYELFAEDEKLMPGAVGIVDERFGESFHANSNEKMMKETGLLRYLEMRNIPFYPILQNVSSLRGGMTKQSREDMQLSTGSPRFARDDVFRNKVAEAYDEKVRELHAIFQKSVALLGIGADGHTAGIPVRKSKVVSQKSKVYDNFDLITEYNDESGVYGERVTMTFLGLSMMDLLVVLVFGDDKKDALEWMFEEGSEEQIPARFYKRPEIASKTIIITDQSI